MALLYTFFVGLLSLGLKVFSLFNEKARKGMEGRKQSFSLVQKIKNEKVIWMHAASLGEYEQGLPVLEKLKTHFPNHKILITFFSPSGYEIVVKKPNIADVVCYLPLDKKKEIQKFVSQFKTELFFTVKYDFWYHLLAELKKQGARTFVVSALFYKKQVFFKPWGKWMVHQLRQSIDFFFHQTPASLELAKSVGISQGMVSGDTRYDRVRGFLYRDNHVPYIGAFIGEHKVVVIGSSWQGEEEVLEDLAVHSTIKIIIAPHDLGRVKLLKKKFPNAFLYSQISENEDLSKSNILIIDCIGLLNRLYSYADVAVVGGGFHSKGLHNILEAAIFGIPVFFGNQYQKNPEADDLIGAGGAKSFAKPKELTEEIVSVIHHPSLQAISEKTKEFMKYQLESTQLIVNQMLKK